MELDIIDVFTGSLRAVHRALISMSGKKVDEMPYISKQEGSSFMVLAPDNTFSSVILFEHPKSVPPVKGALVVYLSKLNVINLFGESLGFTADSSKSEMADACGELCNLVLGGFKSDMAKQGYGEIEISTPRNYVDNVSEVLPLQTKHRYYMSFSSGQDPLISVTIGIGTA